MRKASYPVSFLKTVNQKRTLILRIVKIVYDSFVTLVNHNDHKNLCPAIRIR
jgi:hypothetical protein